MTDGHGVSLDVHRDHSARRILAEVEAGRGVSQRSLARSAGIALGLTNLILKNLVRRGWVRVARVKANRVRYLITPTGLAEKARMSSAYFAYTTRLYAEARARIRERFVVLSATWPSTLPDVSGPKRVAFYGAAEVAEIGYVCLQETDLIVTAVFDANRTNRFFGATVRPATSLHLRAQWDEFGMLVVMAFGEAEIAEAMAHLAAIQFPPDRVFWI